MIRQKIYLEQWQWTVYAYYSVGHYYTEEIMERLVQIGCTETNIRRAYRNLSSGHVDTGLTFSNPKRRISVMVIGYASSGGEFFNSLLHEMRHLEEHILNASGVEPYGEPVAYLIGDLAKEVYPGIHHLLCDCCRAT